MILWRIQDLYDAGICDAGRVDCEAYMAETGKTTKDWLTAVEGLFGGVAGTLWGMGYVKKGCGAEAANGLSLFILGTARQTTSADLLPTKIWLKLEQFYRGHKFNLTSMRENLRAGSHEEGLHPCQRAIAAMFLAAFDETTPLNVRAVRVSEQAMLAATYHEGHAVPSTDAYKAEYQRQYDQLKQILES